jgi:hypothetical protein
MSQTPAAGYSGKPVWQKLGLATGLRVLVLHAPRDYAALVGCDAAALDLVGRSAAFDLAHVFVDNAALLGEELVPLSASLPADGVVWISWPRKGSGVATDVSEDTVRQLCLPLGLVDIKVCAIDATWSALKLMWRRELRAGKITGRKHATR